LGGKINDLTNPRAEVMPGRLRWLAAATGCVAFVDAFLGAGLFLESALLALCALVQPRSPRLVRWLMWVSAFSMSVWMCQLAIVLARDAVKTLPSYHDRNILAVETFLLLGVVLLLWCDAALIMDALRPAHQHPEPAQKSRSVDWLVRMVAIGLTADYVLATVLAVRPYRIFGRIDLLITGIVLTSAALMLDTAMVLDALKR
jgi:hypothetical protein